MRQEVHLRLVMGKMTPFLRSGTKLIISASAAALLSAVFLGVMQYRSLVSIRDQTKDAIEENLRETLQSMGNVVGAAVDADAQNLAAQVLSPLESVQFSRQNGREVEAELAAIMRAHREADRVFIFDFATRPPNAYFRSPSGTRQVGMYQWGMNPEIHRAIESHNEAEYSLPTRASRQNIFTRQESCNSSNKGCKSVLYVFCGFANGNFAGMVLDPKYVREKFLSGLLPELVGSSKHNGSRLGLVVGVLDQSHNQIYATTPDFLNYEVKESFGPAFPNWQLAIGYQNTTIEAVAKANLQKSLFLTLILLVVLVVGIALTLRASAKGMRLAELKSAFVANVSHELKTPVALIRLFAETLELGRVESKEKAREYYRIINNESQRLTQLIDNILDFSQMEAGRREYHFVRADLSVLVEDIIGTYKYQIASLGFELTTHIEPSIRAARIDTDAISQAVLNLLNNAVKYSAESKEITISVESRGQQLAIEVADNGIGIAPSEQEKIFEKFYRVSTAPVNASKGSGLGLTLVRHIVEAHGGEISVDSAPEKGSRFTILLPQDSEAMTQTSDQSRVRGYSLAEDPHN
jgi:signal transduction histidine kinase